jgi:hypothetical protein
MAARNFEDGYIIPGFDSGCRRASRGSDPRHGRGGIAGFRGLNLNNRSERSFPSIRPSVDSRIAGEICPSRRGL